MPNNDDADRLDAPLTDLLDDLSSRPAPDTRLGHAQARALAAAKRATTWGPMRPIAELGWRVYGRDRSIAGGVMAAAIAYRVFIWILPLTLFLVAGLGLYANSLGETSEESLDSAGVGGYLAESVANAADNTSVFAHIVVAISSGLVFLYESYVLLRTLRAVSAFAWGLRVTPMRNPPVATLVLLAAILLLVATPVILATLRDTWGLLVLVTVPAAILTLPIFFIGITLLLLPHDADHWYALIPGALVFGLGMALLELFAGLILATWLAQKEDTYGVLGVAAGLLLGFFIFGRLIVVAASVNAVTTEDRRAAEAARRARRRSGHDGRPHPSGEGPAG